MEGRLIEAGAICPVCGQGGKMTFLAEVSLIRDSASDLLECPGCGVIFFEPLPTASQLDRFYSGSYYDFDRGKLEGKGLAFASRLKKISRSGRFLDVGCATGYMIEGIRKNSEWKVCGVDIGKEAVRIARDSLGLDVREGSLVDAEFPDSHFDYIHVNNVLEHVPDPLALLRECRRIIKPEGILYLSVPNGSNDCLELIDYYKEEKAPSRSKNGHIFFFPARCLLGMFARTGFQVNRKRTYGFKRGLRNMGLWPRKSNWKDECSANHPDPARGENHVSLSGDGKNRPALYYRVKFMVDNWRRLPGLHRFGLDFQFILRPDIRSGTGKPE